MRTQVVYCFRCDFSTECVAPAVGRGLKVSQACYCGSTTWSLSPREEVERLVNDNMRLVRLMAKLIAKRCPTIYDCAGDNAIMSAGYHGLLRAARRVEPARAHKFSAYAKVTIRWQMVRCIKEHRKYSARHQPLPEYEHFPSPVKADALDVAEMLSSLDRLDRRSIELTVMEGYSTVEAASIIGVKQIAVERRRERGLRCLRELCTAEAPA